METPVARVLDRVPVVSLTTALVVVSWVRQAALPLLSQHDAGMIWVLVFVVWAAVSLVATAFVSRPFQRLRYALACALTAVHVLLFGFIYFFLNQHLT